MELPDLETLRELILLLKSADVSHARVGDIELNFLPPPAPEPVRQFVPPALAGTVVGQPEVSSEPKLPPGYAALFPHGIPTRRSE